MSKKKKKSRGKKARKNTKRSRAAKRAYKKSGLYAFNKKRKKGYGKSKKKHGRKKSRRYSILGQKQRHKGRVTKAAARKAAHALLHSAKSSYIAKGYTPKQAHKLASRYVRALKHRAAKAGAAPTASERVAAAMQSSMRAGAYN